MKEKGIENDQKYTFYNTAGGSMFPFVRCNEQIVVKKMDPCVIEVGDIILFSDKNGSKVAHRVVNRKPIGGKLVFQTKGDNNDFFDEPITEADIIGRVVILKRKNAWFALPSKGLEHFRYKLSCFFIYVQHLFRKMVKRAIRGA